MKTLCAYRLMTVLTAIFLSGTSIIAQQTISELEQAILHYSFNGQSEKILSARETLVKRAKKEYGTSDPRYLKYLMDLFYVYLRNNKEQDAKLRLAEAFEIYFELLNGNLQPYLGSLQILIQGSHSIYLPYSGDSGHKAAAIECQKDVIRITKEAYGEDHGIHLKQLDHLATLYQAVKQFDQAEVLLKQIKNTLEPTGKTTPLPYIQSLERLVTNYDMSAQYAQALALQYEVVELKEQLLQLGLYYSDQDRSKDKGLIENLKAENGQKPNWDQFNTPEENRYAEDEDRINRLEKEATGYLRKNDIPKAIVALEKRLQVIEGNKQLLYQYNRGAENLAA